MDRYSLIHRYFYYAEIEWFPAKSYFILFNPDRVTYSHCPSFKPARETFCSIYSQNGSEPCRGFINYIHI